jgi:hypothetical protein
MKRFLLFLLIFCFCYFQGQIRNPNHEMLLGYEKKALYFEAKRDYNEALKIYCNIKSFDSITDLGKRAISKINYLLPICQAETVNKLIGKWKLKKKIKGYETDITFTDLIEFTREKIIFIEERECNEQVIESHELLIEPFIQKIDSDFPTIKFGKNEIWFLTFREMDGEKRLLWEKRAQGNTTIHMLDERSMIKNPSDQKKAMEGEITTYYVKME